VSARPVSRTGCVGVSLERYDSGNTGNTHFEYSAIARLFTLI
jgi:hypothetical protein